MRVVFAGTPDFAASSLKALLKASVEVVAVYTQPDRASGRGRKLTPSPVKQVAIDAGIDVYQPTSLKDEAVQAELKALNSDLMIVVAYGQLLPQAVLDLPTYGCINVHASLLPRWRGAAPIQHAILAGDEESGITIMQMDQGLDTGSMLARKSVALGVGTTGESLHDALARLGAELLIDTLPQIAAQKVIGEAQNDELATYAHKLSKAQGAIDWQQSAEQIERQIRAFNPWPVSYTQYHGDVVRVWMAQLEENHTQRAPGSIVRLGKCGIVVQTGQGCLTLTQLQLAGGKVLGIEQILAANKLGLQLGEKFTGHPEA